MKQFLIKLLEVSRGVLGVLMDFTRGLIAFLRSVNIDQPRGVLLCVTLQLVVVISLVLLVLTFRNPADNFVNPREGQRPPQGSPVVTESIEPDTPNTALPQPDNL